MIKREMYMSRIRPFIGSELIKVMTGIRRCGKSVMLELIKEELTASGVAPSQFISINFEDMSYAHLQNAEALHAEIKQRAAGIQGKAYLFFDEIQEVKDWEKCMNSLRVSLDMVSSFIGIVTELDDYRTRTAALVEKLNKKGKKKPSKN